MLTLRNKIERMFIRVCLFIAFLFFSSQSFGQEIIPGQLEELSSDLKARTDVRFDNNDNPCALIRVVVPILQDLKFKGRLGIIGDIEYSPGEYCIYVPEGTTKLTITHNNFLPCTLNFDKGQIKGKTTYRVVLKLPDNSQGRSTIVRFKTNVQKASLSINGNVYDTDNAEFNIPLTVGEYDYTVSTKIDGFNSVSGHVNVSGKDLICDIPQVNLTSSNMHTLTVYSDKGANIAIDGKSIAKSGVFTVDLPSGIHRIESRYGKSGRWYLRKDKDLSYGNDSVDVMMRGVLCVTSPSNATFSIEPIGESFAPQSKSFVSGTKMPLLGSYNVTVKKKGYNTTTVRVSVGVNEVLNNYSIDVTSVADNYYYGRNGKKLDKTKARKEYSKIAAEGDELALYQLGNMEYEDGNLGTALNYWKQSAGKGYLKSMKSLYKYSNDNSVRMDYATRVAETGDVEAMVDLAKMYGAKSILFNDKSSKAKELEWFLKAYEAGDNSGAVFIADCYNSGDCIGKDFAKARYFYSLDRNNVHAQEMLANYMYYGIEQERDASRAIEIYKGLADRYTVSDNTLCKLVVYEANQRDYQAAGMYLYKIKDINVVKEDFELPCSRLEAIAESQYNKNDAMALKLYDYAIKAGSQNGAVYCHLGLLYLRGRGTSKNVQEAQKYLQLAASKKHPEGTCYLGACYEEFGQYKNAFMYYQKAISLGYTNANGRLGTLYSKGQYVKKDLNKAVSYWLIAARNGHQQSIKNLVLYYNYKKNNSEAEKWRAKLK